MKEKICIIEGCGIKRYGRRLSTGKRSEELVEYAREILQRYGTITEKIVVSSVGKAGYKAYSNPWITNKMMGDFIGEIEDDLKPRLRLVDGDL